MDSIGTIDMVHHTNIIGLNEMLGLYLCVQLLSPWRCWRWLTVHTWWLNCFIFLEL